MTLTEMLVVFTLTFGLMNKLPKKVYFTAAGEERPGLLGRLLRCSYCVGFHAGWLTWCLSSWATGDLVTAPPGVLLYALAGAAAGYLLDVASAAAERHGR